jgi:hypothetical protein
MGARFFYADNHKAVTELDLQVTPLRHTIQRAVEWLQQEGRL